MKIASTGKSYAVLKTFKNRRRKVMAQWQEDNLSSILEYPFDFDRYIAERLREIDDLEERRFAKEVLVEGIGRGIRKTDQRYRELEQRIYREISIPDNGYEIVSTVVRREHYDPESCALFPVMPLDLDETACREALSEKGRLYLGTIYLEADRQMCRRFGETEIFKGSVCVGGAVEEREFFVQKAERYRKVIEQLYHMFQDNHIPWETVNTAYLDKLFDVYLTGEDNAQGNIGLKEADIHFGAFGEAVHLGKIPLWNIEPVTFSSMNFMVPCIDGIYYEHEFVIEEENRKDGYLIQKNEDILEIRHEKDRIIIQSTKEAFEGWSAVRIVQSDSIGTPECAEPFLTNRKKDSFMRRYTYESKVSLLTKAELFRRIMELDIKDYIEVVDDEILENGKDYPLQDSMNWFVRDELFPMESRKVLLLKFKEKKPGFYLNDSMVWFAVSQMQLEISEYRCVGMLGT